jgi:hypothetical protein
MALPSTAFLYIDGIDSLNDHGKSNCLSIIGGDESIR